MMLFGMAGSAQNAGTFSIPATTSGGDNPYFDPTTGITRCTINWIGNIPSSSGSLFYVQVFISGTAVCLNNEAGANPTVIHPGFTAVDYPRATFTDNEIELKRVGSITLPDPKPYADPPNTPFMVLQFRAQPGSSSNISISGYANFGNNIGVASADITPPGFSIVGSIFKPTLPAFSECNGFGLGTAIPNVTVTKTATTGGAGVCFPGIVTEQDFILAGFYQFDNNLYFTPYRVRPSKTNVTEICCEINSLDVALFNNNWIIFPDLMTNQQALAADFNGNGIVTFNDKIQIYRCSNGLPVQSEYFELGWTPWRFAPFWTFPPEAPVTVAISLIPDFIDIVPSGPISPNNSFWGVKRGDLNNSCADCGSSVVSDVPIDRSSKGAKISKIKLNINDLALTKGQETLIPIMTEACRNVSDILLELMFDRSLFEVKSIEEGFLPEEFPVSGIFEDQNATAVRFGWLSTDFSGINIPENAVLFYVRVQAKKDISSLKNAIWQLADTDRNMILSQVNGKFELGINQADLSIFSAELRGANPTSESTQLFVTLPKASSVQITTIGSTGHIFSSMKVELPLGTSEVAVANLPILPGIYTLLVQCQFGHESLRLIKI